MHVAIIGAGIIGASCAAQLARSGHTVTLIDREGPGSGCSFGNAGLIVPSALPLASPQTLRQLPHLLFDHNSPLSLKATSLPHLTPWFLKFLQECSEVRFHANARELHQMTAISLAAYHELLGGRLDDFIRHSGYLTVYETERGFAAACKTASLRRSFGCKIDEFDASGSRDLAPGLAPSVVGSILAPGAAHVIDLPGLINQLASSAKFLQSQVHAVRIMRHKVEIVHGSGSVGADIAVVAAGTATVKLLRPLGVSLPVVAERGYHAMLKPASPLPLPVMSGEGGVVLTPMKEGLRLAGTSEFANRRATPDWRRVSYMTERAKRLFPEMDTEIVTRWVGSRPATPNSLPLIKFVDPDNRVIAATGHGHTGVTFGALSGRLVAELVDKTSH